MATEILNGVEVRVNVGANGSKIYSKNFRSMKDECLKQGTTDFRVNVQKHAFFLGGNAYYVGKSLHGMNASQLAAEGKELQICDSSTDGNHWVPCIFKSSIGEAGSFDF